MRIGFAGLGRMGAAMARNIAAAGFDLTVWNRTETKARVFASQTGGAVAKTPSDLAESCDVVISMLADDAASEDFHLGARGVFASNAPSFVVVMGTMSPDHISALVDAAPEGTIVIDAPVSGATQAARDAQLLIMAGCTAHNGAVLAPLFDAMGKRTVFLDRTGAGAIMKLAVNALIHGLNQTVSEALSLTDKAGIATELAFDVIEASAAAAPMLSYRRPLYLDDRAHEVTFTVALARKDMEITAALARGLGAAFPQGRETLARLQDAEVRGYGQRDMAAMRDYMRKESQ
ncbi:NAD(P)-dependent oxidoreductase [Sedimentitalea sp. CAU 1593]|uniref:NAD(P)-dependent oxidoreductase n=2 Tax=Sedimentitalea arenosa TaxID=2798803 RepID=A0A8J7IQ96_9RHOB|nr:NAD(P)-dependent oxidoreductase [Arenibacterium arenosum]